MDTALDRALRVFRERGYHATSIGDLTAAMRLATGSVYKAFRDKHAVFLAAFERYTALRQEQTRSADPGIPQRTATADPGGGRRQPEDPASPMTA